MTYVDLRSMCLSMSHLDEPESVSERTNKLLYPQVQISAHNGELNTGATKELDPCSSSKTCVMKRLLKTEG